MRRLGESGCLSCPSSRGAAVVAHVGIPCGPTELGAWHLRQALPAASTDKNSCKSLVPNGFGTSAWDTMSILSVLHWPPHCCGMDVSSAAPKRRTLTQQLRSAFCSKKLVGTLREENMCTYSMYVGGSTGHCIYIGQKV